MTSIETALILIALAGLGGFWALVKIFKQRELAVRTALEETQRLLDLQSSKVNILMRALPNLHALLANTRSTDAWKILFLEEARALIRADGASYWRLNERDQKCELETARGSETQGDSQARIVDIEYSDLGQGIQQRLPIIALNKNLISPLIIEGNILGVFRFVKTSQESFQQKDVDILHMFVKQLSLALENQSMLVNREQFYLELVQALADTLDSRDASREGQTRQARVLARGIAKEMALPDEFIYYLEFAALMHDIGNIAIDEQLLKKPGKLTTQEFDLIKKHPELGYKILAPVSLLAPVAPMVLYHQEWFNGKGYPDGLVGEEIPLGARIVAVLDAWGAMTSHRPWRRALNKEDAINEIRKGSGTQFDPKIVEAFFNTLKKQGVSA